jgi:hypothetical protein
MQAHTREHALGWIAKVAFAVTLVTTSRIAPLPANQVSAAETVRTAQTASAESSIVAIELFEAMRRDAIKVRFIPQSAVLAVVYFENLGSAPIDLRLPAAFGAVHVLAQPGGGYGGGAFGGGGGLAGAGAGGLAGAGGGQGLGGGFGGGIGGGAGGGIGGGLGGAFNGVGGGVGGFGGGGGLNAGFFRLEPGKVRKLSLNTVCLEHGKPDPNPRMIYRLVPLQRVNDDPAIEQVCQLLGAGNVQPAVAQAAAWHLANGLSWDTLRHKNRHESKFTGNISWFSSAELELAWELSQRCRAPASSHVNVSVESTTDVGARDSSLR